MVHYINNILNNLEMEEKNKEQELRDNAKEQDERLHALRVLLYKNKERI